MKYRHAYIAFPRNTAYYECKIHTLKLLPSLNSPTATNMHLINSNNVLQMKFQLHKYRDYEIVMD